MFKARFALVLGGVVLTSAALAMSWQGGSVVTRGSFQQKGQHSPHEVIGAYIDGSSMMIVYGRPFSKDPKSGKIRKIWGEVVPYGEAWRTGADDSTLFCTSLPIVLGDKEIPPGAFALYTIPQEIGPSKLHVSKTIGQRGIPVDRKNDLVVVDLKKEMLDKQVDQFTMAIDKSAAGGVLKMMWEKTQFSVPFTVVKKK